MKRLVWLAATVALTLATLPPLAHASPPDETWIRGLYDNADYDDVVLLVTSLFSTQGSFQPEVGLLYRVVATLAASIASRIIDFGLTVRVPRGPPSA